MNDVLQKRPFEFAPMKTQTTTDDELTNRSPVQRALDGARALIEAGGGIQQGMIDAAYALDKTALMVPIRSVDSARMRQMISMHPPRLVMLCWRRDNPEGHRIAARFHSVGIPHLNPTSYRRQYF